MPPVVPQHQDMNLIVHYPEEEVVTENPQPGAAKIVLEETELGWIGRDPILRRLHVGEEPITQFGAAFPIEVPQRDREVCLDGAMKTELHLPTPR